MCYEEGYQSVSQSLVAEGCVEGEAGFGLVTHVKEEFEEGIGLFVLEADDAPCKSGLDEEDLLTSGLATMVSFLMVPNVELWLKGGSRLRLVENVPGEFSRWDAR
jgi:hypothetical protein